jgi:hypothetical protein
VIRNEYNNQYQPYRKWIQRTDNTENPVLICISRAESARTVYVAAGSGGWWRACIWLSAGCIAIYKTTAECFSLIDSNWSMKFIREMCRSVHLFEWIRRYFLYRGELLFFRIMERNYLWNTTEPEGITVTAWRKTDYSGGQLPVYRGYLTAMRMFAGQSIPGCNVDLGWETPKLSYGSSNRNKCELFSGCYLPELE